ncbi:acyl-CoA thioesterase [Paraliobacillus salinarum]|uniref:acyl-CoA thioesterase n=1 Tax=Paraliobacillus salinarum TaxID=1158996 RepID=UPI0015F59B2C|nr:acyl-CoA thioesterase [Paraliobacillus salinarum]
MEPKPSVASLSVKNSHVLPSDTNGHGTLFGGQLMAYIDDIAAISATRHARKLVVTASIDSVDFLHPVKEGDTICLEAFVTYAHRTSMEVFVKAVTENLLTGERKVCANAFITMVAIDENSQPTTVPEVYPESEEEKWLYREAEERMKMRRERRKVAKEMSERFGTAFPWNETSRFN